MAVGNTAIIEVEAEVEQTSKSRRAPPITPAMASAVGELVGRGMMLHFALASQNPPITPERWKQAFEHPKFGTRVVRAFQSKVAEGVQFLLDQVTPANKGWQAAAWRLERVHGYTTQKGGGITVNVNTINGIDNDILKRAKGFVTVKPAKVTAG